MNSRNTKDTAAFNLRGGDYVEVRSAADIMATLDSEGCLDGLPFMPEMVDCCGKIFQVFKRVDKIIDVINKTGLRRMSRAVNLNGVRCDGKAHGGCQQGCQLLWKEAWLRRSSSDGVSVHRTHPVRDQADTPQAEILERLRRIVLEVSRHGAATQEVYRCQATELFRASSSMVWWEISQYLSPLWSGNIALRDFLRVGSIALFNKVQRFRGGCEYPYWEGSNLKKTPTLNLGLRPGELVKVKSKEEILKTLDSGNRNRGLWFDREMLRFCGGRFRVLTNVETIIQESSGKLLSLQNPCVILEGVTSQGAYYRFNPQNDYILWREIWLHRVDEHVDTGLV